MRLGLFSIIFFAVSCLSQAELPRIEAFFSDREALQLLLAPDGKRWALLSREAEMRILTAGELGEESREWSFGSADQQVFSFHWTSSRTGLMQVETPTGREMWVADFPDNASPSYRRVNRLAPTERFIGLDGEWFLTRRGTEDGSIEIHAYSWTSQSARQIATFSPMPDDVEACQRFALVQTFETDGRASLWRVDGDGRQLLQTFAADDSFRVARIMDESIWLVTNQGNTNGLAGLQRVSLRGGKVLEQISDPSNQGDVFCCLFTSDNEVPAYVEFVHPDSPPFWKDGSWPSFLEDFPGYHRWRPVSFANDGKGAFQATDSSGRPWFLIVDRKKQKIIKAIPQYPSLAGIPLGKRFSATIEAGGLTIPTIVTTPPGWRATGNPAPTIVFPHGGPFTQVSLDFDSRVQFLASRGYVILQPNYRGSTGFGRRHQNAALRNWGPQGIQQDLDRVVDWAVKEGYTDSGAVGVFGGSFGGYLALSTACFRPERYRCAAAFFAPSCIAEVLMENPAGISPSASLLKRYFGDPHREDERKEMVRWSPRFAAPRIPLLLYHGARDPLIAVSHSVEMLKQEGATEIVFLLDSFGSHGFGDTKIEIAAYTALEQFFAKHLGGNMGGANEAMSERAAQWSKEGRQAIVTELLKERLDR